MLVPSLTTCSDHSKPYMILTALDESYKNHSPPSLALTCEKRPERGGTELRSQKL